MIFLGQIEIVLGTVRGFGCCDRESDPRESAEIGLGDVE